jgi:hypothetical protein
MLRDLRLQVPICLTQKIDIEIGLDSGFELRRISSQFKKHS